MKHQWQGTPVELSRVSCFGGPVDILLGRFAGLYINLLDSGFLELFDVLSLQSFPARDVTVRNGAIDQHEVYGTAVNDSKKSASKGDA